MRRNWRPLLEHHRALLARERGAVRKEPGGRLNLALIYPNTYAVGLANLGLAVVYRLCNQRGHVLCERAFLPDRQSRPLYAKTGAPLLTLESGRPVADFDLVLASISFENDAPNLAAMLDLAGLGMRAIDRAGPLVVTGGVAAMLNPEPLAEIVDGFLLGEAEVVLGPFLEALDRHRDLPRAELLYALARKVEGFYAPALYEPRYSPTGILTGIHPSRPGLPERVRAPKYQGPAAGLAQSVFSAPGPEFGEMTLLEVGRGCGHACRFCAAGHVYRPPRLGRAQDYRDAALAAAATGGRVGLVSAAVTDLPGLDGLAREITAAGGKLGVSSLRADRLTPELARALATAGHHSVALAPEAGSERLRRIINKHLTEEDLHRAAETLIGAGVANLRLYFMIGLPGEGDDDLESLIALAKSLRAQVVSAARPLGRLGQLTVSLNAFIPKPWTPFQWEPMAPLALIGQRLARVQDALKSTANLKVIHDVPKYAQLQAVLARGDRRLGHLITTLAQGHNPPKAYGLAGVDPDFYAHRRLQPDQFLPWSIVDHGIDHDYLWQEAQRAAQGLASPTCHPGRCTRCGACEGGGEGE
ncbi:MAG: radical SAM protein [Desulfarculus sp.]|nr:radical SAM protein [Desulfarculus sp.]